MASGASDIFTAHVRGDAGDDPMAVRDALRRLDGRLGALVADRDAPKRLLAVQMSQDVERLSLAVSERIDTLRGRSSTRDRLRRVWGEVVACVVDGLDIPGPSELARRLGIPTSTAHADLQAVLAMGREIDSG